MEIDNQSANRQSASMSAAGSTFAAPSVASGSAGKSELTSTQQLIVNALGLSPTFAQRERSTDIRIAYSKYLAIHDAAKELSKMKIAQTWTGKTPPLETIVGIFMSTSAYFKNHHKVFPKVPNFPAMEKWLTNAPDAPATDQVWGNQKATFKNLDEILNKHESSGGKEAGKKSSEKGKKKQVEPASDFSSSEEVVKKKKTKTKAKEKGKVKKSQGSSSKSRQGRN
jgi:hypothetical protein